MSCNLVDPLRVGPAEVYEAVARLLAASDAGVARCELVGLVPEAVLEGVPTARWTLLDLQPESTIEARLENRGFPHP